MSMRVRLRELQEQNRRYFLVFWPEEVSVSVVRSDDIVSPELQAIGKGVDCKVKIGKKLWSGKVAAVGPKDDLEDLESRFLEGKFTPFSEGTEDVDEQPKKKRRVSSGNRKENRMPTSKKCRKATSKVGKATQKKKQRKPASTEPTGNIIIVGAHGDVNRSTLPNSDANQSTSNTSQPSSDTNQSSITNHPSPSNPILTLTSPILTPTNLPSQTSIMDQPTPDQSTSIISPIAILSSSSDMDIASISSSISRLGAHLRREQRCTSSNSGSTGDTVSDTDPVLLEMTVRYLEEKVSDMAAVQKTILMRLDNIETLIRGQDKRAWYAPPDTGTQYVPPTGAQYIPPTTGAQYIPPTTGAQYIPPTAKQARDTCQDDERARDKYEDEDSYWYTSSSAYTEPWYAPPDTGTQNVPPTTGAQYTPPTTGAQYTPPTTGAQYIPPTTGTQYGNTPKAQPILPKPNATSLPSGEICKRGLVTKDVFFQSHRNLKGESKAGVLTVKLAREVYFGTKTMARCTVFGRRDLPGLPTEELGELKQTVFPQFWKTPVEFESLWARCIEAINQACKKLRQTAFH